MSYYDDIYHRVQEMNRDWRSQVAQIRSDVSRARTGLEPRSQRLQTVAIVGGQDATHLGKVTVDECGNLKSVDLDAYAVHGMFSEHVAEAVVKAINNAVNQAFTAAIKEGAQ